jgi:hypothetical protein
MRLFLAPNARVIGSSKAGGKSQVIAELGCCDEAELHNSWALVMGFEDKISGRKMGAEMRLGNEAGFSGEKGNFSKTVRNVGSWHRLC